MEQIDIELRRQNSLFISRKIFNRYGNGFDIDNLHKCIEILKSKQFAKKRLKYDLLDISVSVFWTDLYYLNFYDTTIAELKSKLDTVKSRYECEDDIDDQYEYKKRLDLIQSNIEALNTIIELTKQVRQLMLVAIPDIETLWEQKLIEHNELQENWKAEILEREQIRAEKVKKRNAIKKPDSTPPPKPFAGLLIDLSDKQLDKLFELIKEFINIERPDRQSFDFIFGGKDKPNQFKPIEWIANKQFLRDLLTGLQKEETYNIQNTNTRELSNEIKRQIELFFIDNDTKQPLKLPKNNNRLKNRAEYTRITKFLATI